MRLMVLNANTTAFVTETVAAEARAALGAEAVVTGVTARFGAAVIRTRLDNAVATHAVAEAAALHAGDADAILLGVSYDTGLDALREALAIPVVGMTEATIAMARMVGGRIGYLSLGARSTPLYRDALARHAIERDIAGWRTIEAPAAYAPGAGAALDAMLAETVETLAGDGADVVVMLGAVLAGAAARLRDHAPLPVLDGGRCGALMAQAMTRLAPPKPRIGAFAAPQSGVMTGVDPALAALAARGP
jgi:allantoin racemase